MRVIHHEPGPSCQGCFDLLEDGHPDLYYYFCIVKKEKPEAHLSCVHRNEEEQNQAVREKRSRLKWPNSMHNHMEKDVKCSLAMDFFRLSAEGKAEFPIGFYLSVAQLLEDVGATIQWGGSWRDLHDYPHFQLTEY